MGRKLNTNPKALEARERKETQKRAKNEAKERQRLDEFWRDDDKHVNRKIDRQRERDIKAQEETNRKAALKAEYEKDMQAAELSAKSKAAKQASDVPKVSRASIQASLEQSSSKQISSKMSKLSLNNSILVPNLNRLEDDCENASSVEQAIDMFKSSTSSGNNAMKLK